MKVDYLSFTQALRGAKNAQGINSAHNLVYVSVRGLTGYVLHMDSEIKYRAPFRVIEPSDSEMEFVTSLDLYKSISHFATLPNLVDAVISLDIEGYGAGESNVMAIVLKATLQAGENTRDVVTRQAHVCYTGEEGLKERFAAIIQDIDTDLTFGVVDLTSVNKAFNLMGANNVTEVGKLEDRFILVGQDTLAEVDLEFGADFIESIVMPGNRMAVISKLISNFKELQVGMEVGEDVNRLVLIETMPDTVKVEFTEGEESEISTNSGGLQACLEISIPADLEMNLQVVQENQNLESIHLLDIECKLADILIKGILGNDSSKILELHMTDSDEMTALFAGSTYNKTTIPADIINKESVGTCIKVDYMYVASWISNFRKLEFRLHELESGFAKLIISTGGTRLFLEVAQDDSDIVSERESGDEFEEFDDL